MSCYFVQYTDSQGTTVPPETDIDTDKNDIKGIIIILNNFHHVREAAIFSITNIFGEGVYVLVKAPSRVYYGNY